jgi:hypothetical protein
MVDGTCNITKKDGTATSFPVKSEKACTPDPTKPEEFGAKATFVKGHAKPGPKSTAKSGTTLHANSHTHKTSSAAGSATPKADSINRQLSIGDLKGLWFAGAKGNIKSDGTQLVSNSPGEDMPLDRLLTSTDPNLKTADLDSFLKDLSSALDAVDSICDKKALLQLLKDNGIPLEKLAEFKGKTGNELLKAVLAALSAAEIDVYECLSPATKAGIESDLKAAVDTATKCKRENTAGNLQNCREALEKFSAKLIALGGDKMRDHFTDRLKVILDIYEDTKRSSEAEKQRTANAREAVNKADKFDTLRRVRREYSDIIDLNGELKGLVAGKLLKMVENNAAEADETLIKDLLAADLRLPDKQKLISFEQQGRTYVVLVARDQTGKWSISSKGLPSGHFSVEKKGSNFIVSEGLIFATQLKTREILTNPVSLPTSPSSAPLVPAGYATRQINGNVEMAWQDDGNHKIDLAKGEHKSVRFYYTDPLTHAKKEIKVATGLTEQLAHLLDGNGKAHDGIYDNVIDDDGFKALGDLINFWVDQKHVYGDAASFLEVFNDQSAIIYDVPKAAINEACSTIQGWFEHVDLHDEAAVGKVLEEKNSGGKIINDIVLSYIRGHKETNISANEIADLALRCFVARQTGKHELLHINEKIDTTIETPDWQNLTAAKLLAWYRGESLNEEEKGSRSDDHTIEDAVKKMQIETTKNNGNPEKLYKGKLVGNSTALGIMVEYYSERHDYEKSIEYALQLPDAQRGDAVKKVAKAYAEWIEADIEAAGKSKDSEQAEKKGFYRTAKDKLDSFQQLNAKLVAKEGALAKIFGGAYISSLKYSLARGYALLEDPEARLTALEIVKDILDDEIVDMGKNKASRTGLQIRSDLKTILESEPNLARAEALVYEEDDKGGRRLTSPKDEVRDRTFKYLDAMIEKGKAEGAKETDKINAAKAKLLKGAVLAETGKAKWDADKSSKDLLKENKATVSDLEAAAKLFEDAANDFGKALGKNELEGKKLKKKELAKKRESAGDKLEKKELVGDKAAEYKQERVQAYTQIAAIALFYNENATPAKQAGKNSGELLKQAKETAKPIPDGLILALGKPTAGKLFKAQIGTDGASAKFSKEGTDANRGSGKSSGTSAKHGGGHRRLK